MPAETNIRVDLFLIYPAICATFAVWLLLIISMHKKNKLMTVNGNSWNAILHIYSDWKWTGPSEPILSLCKGLQNKHHNITLACYPPLPNHNNRNLLSEAQKAGINTIPLIKTHYPWSFITDALGNIKKFRSYLNRNPVDIIHSHTFRDHELALRISQGLDPRPLCIWTNHEGTPLPACPRTKDIMENYTDGYLTLSPKLLAIDQTIYNLPAHKTGFLEGTVDLDKFIPSPPSSNVMTELGLTENTIIAGIVARVQRHRRFDILLEAVRIVVTQLPEFRLLVIGRGTHIKELAIEPAQRMGLDKHIIFTGYRTPDYVAILNSLDFGIYLVPGSDGSCRAVREIMALGKPLIVADRGILPELIDNGINGLVVEDTPAKLANAILELARNKSLIKQFGGQARTKALTHFSLESQITKLELFYQNLLKGTPK
jgi:glycosyltransferase involved in cell wall biosynthesis